MRRRFSLLLVVGLSAPVFAEGPAGSKPPGAHKSAVSPESRTARDLVSHYLDLVKAKKWAEAKKLIHPGTLKAIAERKQRLGKEDHPLAAWFHDKETYSLKAFKITDAHPGTAGTVVVETSEDNWQVQEKGLAEGEPSAYLVGKKDGKEYVVDKKRGETFSPDAIRLGYKGFFDKAAPSHEEED